MEGSGHGHGHPVNVDCGFFSRRAAAAASAPEAARVWLFAPQARFFACLAHFRRFYYEFSCATHAVIASCAHSKCLLDAAFVDNGTVIRRTSNSSCAQLHLNTIYWRPGAIGLVHGPVLGLEPFSAKSFAPTTLLLIVCGMSPGCVSVTPGASLMVRASRW